MRKQCMGRMLGILFICLFLTACGKKKKTEEPTVKGNDVIFFRDEGTYTENYVLFLQEGSNTNLWYYDVAAGQAGPFCFDPTCDHKRAVLSMDGKVLQEGCISYEIEPPVYPSGDYLYYCTKSPLRLYRTDRQGNHQEILAEPNKPYGFIITAFFTDEAAYISYQTAYEYTAVTNNSGETEWRAGGLKEKAEAGLLRIPLDGGKEEVIFRSDDYYDMTVYDFKYHDGKLRFLAFGTDCPSEAFSDLDIMNPDDRRFLNEHTVDEGYEYTVNTGELRQLFHFSQHTASYFFDDCYGILDDDERLILYRYDGEKVSESEIVNISCMVSDHGIIAYDLKNKIYIQLNEADGSIAKKSTFSWTDFMLDVVVGNSCFGRIQTASGELVRAYISVDDFWSGKKEGIVPFFVEKNSIYGNHSYQLNPDFDIEKKWKRLAEETSSHVDLFGSANKQIQEWLQK